MYEFKVNVPVKINIWIRRECQQKQFNVIKRVKPSVMFIISDGGRSPEEWKIINEHRKMYEKGIDWDCKVYRLYEDTNQGMYAMIKKMHNFVWQRVDRCIFLEDDIVPSESFFYYCEELLEKYKDDTRISCICGMNVDGISENVSSDYFFSRQGIIWGIAWWKRTIDNFKLNYKDDPYIMEKFKDAMKDNKTIWNRTYGYSQSDYYDGHVAADEFYLGYFAYAQNQLQIIPRVNLISNVGCQSSAAHSGDVDTLPHGVRRLFNMTTYELSFPLKHPEYFVADLSYENRRNKILAFNNPIVRLSRRIEALILNIRAGNFAKIKGKLNVSISKISGRYRER